MVTADGAYLLVRGDHDETNGSGVYPSYSPHLDSDQALSGRASPHRPRWASSLMQEHVYAMVLRPSSTAPTRNMQV